MTDAEPRTSRSGGLLGAFDGAMAGLTEADVEAAARADVRMDYGTDTAIAATPAEPAGAAASDPGDDAAEAVPDPAEPAPHRVVDPRAQAVADRLLGRVPEAPQGGERTSEPAAPPPAARLRAAEGDAVAECAPGSAVVIGRADGDLVVPLGVVSRRHCQVTRTGDRYAITDLGSANGTLVCRADGSTVDVTTEPVELHPGDVIATARGRRPIARFEATAAGGSAA